MGVQMGYRWGTKGKTIYFIGVPILKTAWPKTLLETPVIKASHRYLASF